MTARDDLRAHLITGTDEGMRRADELIDAFRAEVLREGADAAVRAARGCGDSETGQYAASVAAGIGKELRRMADSGEPQ